MYAFTRVDVYTTVMEKLNVTYYVCGFADAVRKFFVDVYYSVVNLINAFNYLNPV